MATQAHPELKSRPNRPHPLFRDFVGAAATRVGLPTAAAEPIREEASQEPTAPYARSAGSAAGAESST